MELQPQLGVQEFGVTAIDEPLEDPAPAPLKQLVPLALELEKTLGELLGHQLLRSKEGEASLAVVAPRVVQWQHPL